jgi:hypothetical protein
VTEDRRGIQVALVNRAEHTREDFLRVRATGRAIPATDFARDNGGAQRVFGAPVRRINGGVEQEGEDARALVREMIGEALREARPTRVVDEGVESIDEVATSDGDTVRRDSAGAPAIPHAEALLDQRGDSRREPVFVVIADEIAAAPQQMGHTCLIDGAREAAIRRPAVADQDAGEVGAQDGGGLVEAAAMLNRIDGRIGRDEGPQPMQAAADLPSRFIRGDDRTPADGLAQRGVGRGRLARGPMQGVDQTARRDVQAEALAEERRDLPQGQAELGMEHRGEGDRLWAQLRGGGAQGIRRLQRMPALHAAMARHTLANGHRECAHDRSDDGEIFLVLDRVACVGQSAAAVRAGRGQRRAVPLVNVDRDGAMRLAAVAASRFPSRPAGRPARGAARERRGLPECRAPREVEVVFEPLDLLAQRVAFLSISIPILIRPLMLASQPFDLALLPLELLEQFVPRRGAPLDTQHALLMPCSGEEYKRKLRRSRRSESGSELITR